MSNTKTLSELRASCKVHGIKVKKQSLSWGPHLSFEINGQSASSVMSTPFYYANQKAFEALAEIKKEYHGMSINGQQVYGLK